MPAHNELLWQKAVWAIRTYVKTRPDDYAVEEVSDELKAIRDRLKAWATNPDGADGNGTQARLAEIAADIVTLSGAPIADSVAYRAANILSTNPEDCTRAAEVSTIGLSAAN